MSKLRKQVDGRTDNDVTTGICFTCSKECLAKVKFHLIWYANILTQTPTCVFISNPHRKYAITSTSVTQMSEINVKFTLEEATKAQRGRIGVVLLFL